MNALCRSIVIVTLSFAGWGIIPAAAADKALDKARPQRDQASMKGARVALQKRPVYKPRRVGKPNIRTVGAGSRGTEGAISLSALTPEHPGLTADAQPTLFWYLSSPTPHPVELIVSAERASEPLLVTPLPAPAAPGIQRVRLADYGVQLDTDVSYRWFVAIVPDADHRSKDIIAGGGIELMAMSRTLHGQLEKTDAKMRPSLYAEAGFWYDALTTISDLIDAAPGDAQLRQQRADLLSQVGLADVASADLKSK